MDSLELYTIVKEPDIILMKYAIGVYCRQASLFGFCPSTSHGQGSCDYKLFCNGFEYALSSVAIVNSDSMIMQMTLNLLLQNSKHN